MDKLFKPMVVFLLMAILIAQVEIHRQLVRMTTKMEINNLKTQTLIEMELIEAEHSGGR